MVDKAKANLSLTSGRHAVIDGINRGHNVNLNVLELDIIEPALTDEELISLHIRCSKDNISYTGEMTKNYTRCHISGLERTLLSVGERFGYVLENDSHQESIAKMFMDTYKVYINPENITIVSNTEETTTIKVSDWVLYGNLTLNLYKERVKLSEIFPPNMGSFFGDWLETPFTKKKPSAMETMKLILEEWLMKNHPGRADDLSKVNLEILENTSGMTATIVFTVPKNHPLYLDETFRVTYSKVRMVEYLKRNLPLSNGHPVVFIDSPLGHSSVTNAPPTSISSAEKERIMIFLKSLDFLPVYDSDYFDWGYTPKYPISFCYRSNYKSYFFFDSKTTNIDPNKDVRDSYVTSRPRSDLDQIITGDEFNMFSPL